MGVQIARWLAATLNFLLSFLFTALFVLIVQLYSFGGTRGISIGMMLYWCFYALLTIAAMMTATLLLKRRTVQAGLKMHFALANVGLLFAVVAIAVEALSRPDRHISAWSLQTVYWIGAVSGLWFATGLTLKTLIECEDEKLSVGASGFVLETVTVEALSNASTDLRPTRPLSITAPEISTSEILSHRRMG